MNTNPTAKESAYLARVKALPCSVCDQPGPSEAHHINQSTAYLCVALCTGCHTGSFNGIHGQRRIWSVKKMGEYDALAVTIRRLAEIR